MGENMNMNKAKKVHEKKEKYVENNKVIIREEFLIDGDKGVLVKFYHKEGDKKDKWVIIGKGGEFIVKETHGETKEPERTVSKKDLLKEIAKNKDLAFALDYLKNMSQSRSKSKGGKRRSKKSKSSKKASKKASKKGSKKRSKRSKRSRK
jgi:hypothetical protein